ncbi:MAG: glycosyltransferase family 2 protein [Ignavibacteriaceae bacterium]|nr:glycosyltransferase family 2 protein [Ignavibacteriaceae bacterium]
MEESQKKDIVIKKDDAVGEQKPGNPERSDNKNFYRRNLYNKRKRYFNKSPHSVPEERISFNKLSIVIPLLNEEESLNPLANEIRKAVKPLNINYEVIFVDDGSTDGSLKIIKDICKQDRRFRYISFRKNYGKSAAMQMGFKSVTGDVVVTMDADLQDDPNEIGNLLKKLQEGNDLVSGWKKKRFDPIIKRYSSRFFNYITRVMSGIKIHDFNCGLKAYRVEVTQSIKVYGELHRYVPVLADWNGFIVAEIPVVHHARRYGKTKFGISRFFKGFIDLVTVIFSTRYIKRPMHFFGFFGALSFLIGIIVNGYLAYEWGFNHQALSNRPMLFLGMLLIIVGVQLFSVGLLGEMLVHNTMDEKEYVIKDKG